VKATYLHRFSKEEDEPSAKILLLFLVCFLMGLLLFAQDKAHLAEELGFQMCTLILSSGFFLSCENTT
jgi:cell division protein FtsW (lipid II flippase)